MLANHAEDMKREREGKEGLGSLYITDNVKLWLKDFQVSTYIQYILYTVAISLLVLSHAYSESVGAIRVTTFISERNLPSLHSSPHK